MLNKKYLDKKFYIFFDIMIDLYLRNRENIEKNIDDLRNCLIDNTKYKFSIYSSEYLVNFKNIFKLLDEINSKYIDNKNLN